MPRTNFYSDPSVFASILPEKRRKHLVLGIDLGTNCGYTFALHRPGMPVLPALIEPKHMGQWDLSAGPYDSGAIRFVRMRQFLEITKPDLVVYEDVKFVGTTMPGKPSQTLIIARAAKPLEFLGAMKATLATWCEEQGIPCTGFPIGTIKRRATGKGVVNKEGMIAACNEMFSSDLEIEGYETTGVDNIADSAFVCLLGLEQYADGLPKIEDDDATESNVADGVAG